MTRFLFYIVFILFIASCGEMSFDNDETVDIVDDEIADDSVAVIYELLEAEDAKDLIDEKKDDPAFYIIDVRTVPEYDGGHIPDAESYNVYDADFDIDIKEFSIDDVFFVYCASGSRSKGAVATMQSLGFLEIYELKGGLSSWKNAGYSVEVH